LLLPHQKYIGRVIVFVRHRPDPPLLRGELLSAVKKVGQILDGESRFAPLQRKDVGRSATFRRLLLFLPVLMPLLIRGKPLSKQSAHADDKADEADDGEDNKKGEGDTQSPRIGTIGKSGI
jgi:hypothetical protein